MIEKEINLASILSVVWERGKRIIVFTIICMILGAGASLLIHNRYEGEVSLFVNLSKIGERTMQYPTIPIETYERFFYRRSMLAEIIDTYNLEDEPYNIKYPQDLKSRIQVDWSEEVNLLMLRVVLEEPEMAAKVANSIATGVINAVDELQEREADTSTELITGELTRVTQEMETYRQKYLQVMQTNLRQLIVNKLNSNMSTLALFRQQKEQMDASIKELRAREAYFKEIISVTGDLKNFARIEVEKAVFAEPLLEELIRNESGEEALENLLRVKLKDESVSEELMALVVEYQKLLVDIPGMEMKRNYYIERIEELEDIVEEQQKELNRIELEEMIAKADFDRTLEIYGGIDKEIGWAGTTVKAERQDLFIMDKAFPNPKKVYPRRSLMVGLVGLIAFLVAFVYYLLIDLYGLMRHGAPEFDKEKTQV